MAVNNPNLEAVTNALHQKAEAETPGDFVPDILGLQQALNEMANGRKRKPAAASHEFDIETSFNSVKSRWQYALLEEMAKALNVTVNRREPSDTIVDLHGDPVAVQTLMKAYPDAREALRKMTLRELAEAKQKGSAKDSSAWRGQYRQHFLKALAGKLGVEVNVDEIIGGGKPAPAAPRGGRKTKATTGEVSTTAKAPAKGRGGRKAKATTGETGGVAPAPAGNGSDTVHIVTEVGGIRYEGDLQKVG